VLVVRSSRCFDCRMSLDGACVVWICTSKYYTSIAAVLFIFVVKTYNCTHTHTHTHAHSRKSEHRQKQPMGRQSTCTCTPITYLGVANMDYSSVGAPVSTHTHTPTDRQADTQIHRHEFVGVCIEEPKKNKISTNVSISKCIDMDT